MRRRHIFRSTVSCLASAAMAVMMLPAVGGGVAVADEGESTSSTQWWQSYQPSGATAPSSTGITTYGVRAGSAGGDYLGISNTNFDFTAGKASSNYQYGGYANLDADDDELAGLAIWASSANDAPNPYYSNLFYNIVNGKVGATAYTVDGATEYYVTKASGAVANAATTWMKNPSSSSWGDSLGYGKALDSSGNSSDEATAAGMEYGDGPDVVFGASKTSGWNNYSASGTNFYQYDEASSTFNPTYANNDATNIWTQIYSLGQLASTVDAGKTSSGSNLEGKTTRYDNNSATASALSYEKSIRGNLLYVASQVDAYEKDIAAGADVSAAHGVKRKTVAYLYAVDESAQYAYIFTPSASQIANSTETGTSSSNSESSPSTGDGSNNGTTSLGYLDVLPLVTNTYSAGESCNITMKVEDIYKSNTVRKVPISTLANDIGNIDYIIYNTSTALTGSGTSGGKNSDGICNTGTCASGITRSALKDLLQTSDTSKFIAGDDFGTSTNQGDEADQAPLLVCQRNYTMDKNARAAWAFSKVYPELYQNKDDSSYAYWVRNAYHIGDAATNAVVAKMTLQSTGDVSACTDAEMESYFQTGYEWWFGTSTGLNDSSWSSYQYYAGPTRASYYGGANATVAASNGIGVMQPSSAWIAAAKPAAAVGYTYPLYGTAQSTGLRAQALTAMVDVPTVDSPIVIGGIQWYMDDNKVIHIQPAPADKCLGGYEPGYMPATGDDGTHGKGRSNKFKQYQWTSVTTLGDGKTGYVVEEGVKELRDSAFEITNDCTTITLPSSLEKLGTDMLLAKTGLKDKTITITIGGVYEDSYTESQLAEIGRNAFGGSGWDSTYSNFNCKISVVIPEDSKLHENSDGAVDITGCPNTTTYTTVPFKQRVAEVVEPKTTVFTADETEKTVEIPESDLYDVTGTTSATEIGSYSATLALKPLTSIKLKDEENSVYWPCYAWSDGTTEDKTISWSIVEQKAYETISAIEDLPEAEAITAADNAKVEEAVAAYEALSSEQKAQVSTELVSKLTTAQIAAAKADAAQAKVALEQAAKDACEAAGIAYDESLSASENVAAAQKAAADSASTAALEQAARDACSAAGIEYDASLTYAQNVAAAQTAAQKPVAQKVFVKVSKKTYKAKALKKKKASFKIGAQAMTKVSYKVTKGKAKYVKVSKKGKVTMKKGARKGTYKVTVTAKASSVYKAAKATVTVKVK